MKGFICQGDATSHGGQVLEASGFATFNGKPVAVQGDGCSCPILGHHNCHIAEGNPNIKINGKAVAFHGCKTTCGAALIADSAHSGSMA